MESTISFDLVSPEKLVFNDIMPLESDFYKNNYISNFLKTEFDRVK